ncbi:hypothetical protein TNCV_3956711 [Trichonephila clavipes]|nr:hypothetical protein TNCV_3956711 [Trichonephila clavipes]
MEATSGLLGASRHVFGHQNTVRRTGTRLKRRLCAAPVSNFVWRTRVAVFFCAALSKEGEVMTIVLTVYAATDIVTPYK